MAVVLCSMMILSGCQFKGHIKDGPALIEHETGRGGGAGGAGGTGGGKRMWQPMAVGIRVYPSSRFAVVDKQPVFEARLEFTDQMKDPIKASGIFHLTLYEGGRVGRGMLGRKLYTWDISLATLAQQRRYYDTVTRTYHLSLKLDEAWNTKNPVTLKVVFVRYDGHRLEAQTILGGSSPAHP